MWPFCYALPFATTLFLQARAEVTDDPYGFVPPTVNFKPFEKFGFLLNFTGEITVNVVYLDVGLYLEIFITSHNFFLQPFSNLAKQLIPDYYTLYKHSRLLTGILLLSP